MRPSKNIKESFPTKSKRLVFLDVDDTLLTPPHQSVKKIADLLGVKDFPEEEDLMRRSEIDFHKAFPHIFRNNSHMWVMALMSLPYGLFRSQKLFPELENSSLAQILKDNRVYLLSKNPPSFTRWRLKRIEELTGINIQNRYLPCGPMFSKSTSKISIIEAIAEVHNISLNDCLLIDDNSHEIGLAIQKGVSGRLLDVEWNKNIIDFDKVKRTQIPYEVEEFLGELIVEKQDIVEPIFVPPSINILKRALSSWTNKFRTRSSASHPVFNVVQSIFDDYKGKSENFKFFYKETGKAVLWTPLGFTPEINLSNFNDENGFKNEKLSKERLWRILKFYTKFNLVDSLPFPFVDRLTGNDVVEFVKNNLNPEEKMAGAKIARSMVSGKHRLGQYLTQIYTGFLLRLSFKNVEIKLNFDLKGLESKNLVIYTPMHRSLFDSAILMNVTGKKALSMPITTAAYKMKNNLVGAAGRLIGTYFIKRSGLDELYKKVIKLVIRRYIINGTSMAVYLEGQRSRRGATLSPKCGILKYILDNCRELDIKNVCFVPISFSYNILPEADSLLNEIYDENKKVGLTKTQEDADIFIYNRLKEQSRFSLVKKIFKLLRKKKVSDAHVIFGEPIWLHDLIDTNREQKTENLDLLVKNIMTKVNSYVPPLATSIACLALLASKEKHLRTHELKNFINYSSFLIKLVGFDFRPTIGTQKDNNLSEKINELPFVNRKFKNNKINSDDFITVTDLDVIRAVHYKNNVLHYYALPALIVRELTATQKGAISSLAGVINRNLIKLSQVLFFAQVEDINLKLEKVLEFFALGNSIELKNGLYRVLPLQANSPFEILNNIGDHIYELVEAISPSSQRMNERFATNQKVNISVNNETFIRTIQLTNISVGGGASSSNIGLIFGDIIEIASGSVDSTVRAKVVNITQNGFSFQFIADGEEEQNKNKKFVFKLLAS